MNALTAENIGVGVHYLPVHLHPFNHDVLTSFWFYSYFVFFVNFVVKKICSCLYVVSYLLIYGRPQLLVCSNCGERYYDRKAMKKIEEIRSKLKNQALEVKEVGKVVRAHAA